MSLADWYQDGTNGLQKNLSERYKWAKRAADLDHAEGISDVGWCAYWGQGTEEDRGLANVLCAQAAAMGVDHACFLLADRYADAPAGATGLPKDLERPNTGRRRHSIRAT